MLKSNFCTNLLKDSRALIAEDPFGVVEDNFKSRTQLKLDGHWIKLSIGLGKVDLVCIVSFLCRVQSSNHGVEILALHSWVLKNEI